MQISKRLEAVADMVTPGCTLADIGTDHAYIPIYLVQTGKIPHAIAMDVNQGPLERAKEHIDTYGLEQKIETRLSDGLAALAKGEAEQILIAGMGGPLIVKILKEGSEKIMEKSVLILQPQSEIHLVRAYLEEIGYLIIRENIVFEDGKYYPMMKAVHKTQLVQEEQGKTMDDLQLRYGPLLLQQKHPVLFAYAKREEMLNLRILDSLKGQRSETAAARIKEVEYELSLIRQVLAKEAASDK